MIPFISSLPIIRNCLKSEEYPQALKRPYPIKVSSIIGTQNVIKKIIGIALVLLILCVVCIFPLALYTNSIPPPSYIPYLKNLKIKTVRNTPKAITTFPPYLKTAIYPGMMTAENGRLCFIPDSMPTFQECHRVSLALEEEVKIHHPSEYVAMTADPDAIYGKGASATKDLEPGRTIKKINFGMDERKVTAFQESLCYIEKEVLHSQDLFKNAGNLVEYIKTTNFYVTKYLNERPGELRNQIPIILNDRIEMSKEDLRNTFYHHGGSHLDISHFESLYRKLGKYPTVELALKHLNSNENRVLNTLGFSPCHPNKINSHLNQLANQIIELALKVENHEADPIAAAAHVHQGLHKISPFRYGNGRTARIWMNILLQIGGFKAVMIPDRQEYFNEIVKDRKSPGTFTTYLKKVIAWNRRQINLK